MTITLQMKKLSLVDTTKVTQAVRAKTHIPYYGFNVRVPTPPNSHIEVLTLSSMV